MERQVIHGDIKKMKKKKIKKYNKKMSGLILNGRELYSLFDNDFFQTKERETISMATFKIVLLAVN